MGEAKILLEFENESLQEEIAKRNNEKEQLKIQIAELKAAKPVTQAKLRRDLNVFNPKPEKLLSNKPPQNQNAFDLISKQRKDRAARIRAARVSEHMSKSENQPTTGDAK